MQVTQGRAWLALVALVGCGQAAERAASSSDAGAGATQDSGPVGDAGGGGADGGADAGEGSEAGGDAGAEAGDDAGGDAGRSDGGTPIGAVARVAIALESYWEGPSRWHATTDQMTPAQIAIVQGFTLVPASAPQASCPTNDDGRDYVVTITDAHGVDTVVHANGMNADCASTGTVLDWPTFQPILATYACLNGQQTQGADSVAHAVALAPDPLCDDGVFATQPEERWFALDVAAAGTHTARVIDCASMTTSLTIYDATGSTVLAASDAPDGGACPAVSYGFAAGTYAMKFTQDGGCCQLYVGFE